MKVLYLIPHSPQAAGFNSITGFIEYAAYHRKICHSLLDRGIQVEMILLSRSKTTKQQVAGIPVETYKVSTGSSFGWELSAPLLKRLRSGADADVVHFHGYNQPNAIPYLAAIIDRIPTVVQNHGSALDKDRLKHKLWYRLVTPLLRRCAKIISVDSGEIDNLAPVISNNSLHHLPNAVDPNQFKPSDPDTAREQLGLRSDSYYGLFVGRLTKEKGVEHLLDAVSSLSTVDDLTILFVYSGGSNDQQKRIERKINELEIADRTKMVGSVEHDKMSLYYNAADFCVFPSISEGFGVVVLEAMACSTPVIASREHLGGGHVVDGENCVVINPRCPTAIADAMQQLLNDPSYREKLGKKGRETVVKQYTYEVVIDDLVDCYRSAIDSPPS